MGDSANVGAMRVLYLDIETTPMIFYSWTAFPQYLTHDFLIQESHLLTWAAQWHGEKKVRSERLLPAEATRQDDKRIVGLIADLVREADVVVAHNADRFDMTRINSRLLKHRLKPMPPVQTIDTLKMSKKHLGQPYNKLDWLGKTLLDDQKLKTDLDLWKRCMAGDLQALRRMERYNRKDVKLLVEVWETIGPYVPGIPRLHTGPGCPNCGAQSWIRRGYRHTKASSWVRLECSVCGRYSRERLTDKSMNAEYIGL
jgi:hypothetical protein